MICRVSPSEFQKWGTWIPLAAAVAVAQYLNDSWPGANVRIKWPNDLWINGKKAGGILCEGVGNSGGSFIVIGIGLNCVDSPDDLDQDAISLSEALAPRKIIADDVRSGIVRAVNHALRMLRASGPASLAEAYSRIAALREGTRIFWSGSKAETSSGVVIGLGAYGELRVRLDDGSDIGLYAEDVKVRPVS